MPWKADGSSIWNAAVETELNAMCCVAAAPPNSMKPLPVGVGRRATVSEPITSAEMLMNLEGQKQWFPFP
jgi:hypothetical protein